jgi:hypothetical protein
MQTLEEFKKWYKDTFKNDEAILEYLADEYIGEFNDPYSPNGYIKIGGKDIPIGDVSEIVDDWFEGNYLEESDLVNECCEWLIDYIKSIDEGKVLKLAKEKKINDKKQAIETDFTQKAT